MGGWRRGARGQRVKQVGMRGRRDAGWGAGASPWTPQGLSSLAAYVAAPWGACGSPCMSRRAVLFRSRCTSRSCLFDPLFDAVDAACLWWGVRLGPDPSGRTCRLLTGAPCWRHGQHPYAKDARAEITRVRRSLGAWDSFSVGAGWGVQGWSACRSGASVRRCAHSRSLRASVRCACRRLGAASARFLAASAELVESLTARPRCFQHPQVSWSALPALVPPAWRASGGWQRRLAGG